MRGEKAQITVEQLLLFTLVLLVVVPSVLFIAREGTDRAKQSDVLEIQKTGNQIVTAIKQIENLGDNSWTTIDILLPKSVKNISINKSEIVIEYANKDGSNTKAVFFTGNTIVYDSNVGRSFNNIDLKAGKIEVEIKASSNGKFTCIGPKGGSCYKRSCADLDGDGVMNGYEKCHEDKTNDCDDEDASISPDVLDSSCDQIDQNCDGGDGEDKDSDGIYTCPNTFQDTTDCNDDDRNVFPGAFDACGDGFDSDCNSGGYLVTQDSRDDGQNEVCDGIDNDCDGSIDDHPDGYATIPWDQDLDQYTTCGTYRPTGARVWCDPIYDVCECNDTDPLINPFADEAVDLKDNDCDGRIDDGCFGDVNWQTCKNSYGYFGLGDLNENDCIDQNDLYKLDRMINNLTPDTDCADYNRDCYVNQSDWDAILEFVPLNDVACYSVIENQSCIFNITDPESYYTGSNSGTPGQCLQDIPEYLCNGDYTANFGIIVFDCRGPDGIADNSDDCGCPGTQTCNNVDGFCYT